MAMRIVHLYGAGSALTNALANIQLPRGGIIRSVQWTVYGAIAAIANVSVFELSFASVAQLTTNDALNIVSNCAHGMFGVTSGTVPATSYLHAGIALPYKVGDRLYLHIAAKTGADSHAAVLNICVED